MPSEEGGERSIKASRLGRLRWVLMSPVAKRDARDKDYQASIWTVRVRSGIAAATGVCFSYDEADEILWCLIDVFGEFRDSDEFHRIAQARYGERQRHLRAVQEGRA